MKILAFSDWRIQPLEMLIELVETHKPDAILYAGDDLDRLIPLDKSLLLKTPNHLLNLNYPDMKPVLSKQNKLFTQKFKKNMQEINFQNNDILQKLEIPFYYVNGNDNFILRLGNTYYRKILDTLIVAETPKGRITIKERDFLLSCFFKKKSNSNKDLKTDVTSGIYTSISPSFGKFTIKKKSEEITIFGCECGSGFTKKIKNKPKEYTDIYLSHLPPLGTLDLSVKFRIGHIGSKELLNAIKKHHPKLVICGHSHIWGGISKKIGDTLVINVSSQDRDPSYGHYALIDTDNWAVEMRTVEAKTMRIIRGITTLRKKLFKKGMELVMNKEDIKNIDEKNIDENELKVIKSFTRYKIKNIAPDIDEALEILNQWKSNNHKIPKQEQLFGNLKKIENLGVSTKRVKERIKSLKWKKPKIIKKITINPDKHAFVDVETGLANGYEPGKLWLIGLWYDRDLKQFLFPKEKKEFLNYLKQNQITSLVSWTNYDRNALYPILKKTNMNIKFIDACQRTSNCVIWYTYRVHELYKALFPDKNDLENLIPGHIAGLYADHLIISNKSCPYCPQKETIIEQIKKRNKIDILQMVEICRKLWYD